MSRTLVQTNAVVTFSEAAATLGISHASLARAMERGEILRLTGSSRAQPLFRPSEVERFRAWLDLRAAEAPLAREPARATTDPRHCLLGLVATSDEHEAAGELAATLLAAAGPDCRRVVILRLDDEFETVRILGDSAANEPDAGPALVGEPVELSSNRYREFLLHSGLGAALARGTPGECEQASPVFGFLEADAARFVDLDLERVLIVPLGAGQAACAAALLLFDADWEPSGEQHRTVAELALPAGIVLEAVRQRHDLTRRVTRVEALQGAARQLARAPDYADLLTRVAELAAGLFGADGAAVLTADGGASGSWALRLGGATGLADAAPSWTATLGSEYLIGRAAAGATPLQVTDASTSPNLALPRLIGGHAALAALCVPIVNRGMVLGAIEVYSARPRAYSDDEIELLTSFAEQTAVAVHSLRGQESRQRALLGAVEALANAIEARDGYTGEHCKRAVSRATLVARQLGLSEREVETIGLAAALHDIGKIAVPDAILRKPGPLTSGEMDVIRRHPQVGEQIVAWVPELREVAVLVGAHQERWDGSGYPNGLAGEQIPIGARIIAVVDAYAAMTEDRPYRAGGTREDAIAELLGAGGSQFDATVVDAFIDIVLAAPRGATGLLDPDRPDLALNAAVTPAEQAPRTATGYLPVRRWHSRRASELAALNDILRAISSTLDLRRIYDLVYRKVSDLIDVDAFMILQAAGGQSGAGVATAGEAAAAWHESEVRVTAGDVTFVEARHFPIIGRPAIDGIVAEAASSGHSVLVADYPRYLEQRGIPAGGADQGDIGSAIAAPIFLGDELLGLISVQALRPNSYDDRHVGLLEEIALHIGLALRNAGVYAEARRRAEQFEAIGRLAARLNQLRDPAEIARAFAAESKHVVHSDWCIVFFVHDNHHVLAAIDGDYSATERAAYRGYSMPRGTGILWWAVEHGETVIVPDLSRDERVVTRVRPPRPGESGLIVPLIHEGQPLAVACIARSGDPFSDDDAQAMNVLAAHAATAISDALLHVEAQRRVLGLEALQRAVALVSANLERETAVKAIVEVLADVFGYRHVSMYNREGDTLVMLAQVGYEDPITVLPIDRGVLARCVRTEQSILLRDVSLDEEFVAATAGLRSEVAVPVFLNGRVVGGLNVESGLERQLGEWDLALIELFSQQVSVALANVSQYEQAVERASIDPVSRLPNHGALMERLNLAVRDAQALGAPLAALFIDLDNFKRFNDAFGHRVGDQVLYAVGRYLEGQLPSGAYVARYGGEEFVALLPETTGDDAQRVAESIRAQLALVPLDTAPRERFPVTVSIGVAAIDNAFSPLTTAEELLDAADQAMYEAKRQGRNRVVRSGT